MEIIEGQMKMINETNSEDITFRNLGYSVPSPRGKERKRILKGISGEFKCGELTAIMGPSGAGKSSLLNILTGFIHSGVEGEVNFSKKTSKFFKTCSYISQEDHLFPWFTVVEIMLMAANLKISRKSMKMKDKQILVESILTSLKLSHTKNTKCSNLSGGQRKRLSVALELIDNPAILFLDEPTTGLDSSAASECINLLKQLSEESRTVICTIHQPSAAVFHAFSHVYVLAEGQCIYRGSPYNVVPFLCSVGLHCPQYHNPADFLLEVANKDYGDHAEKLQKAIECSTWDLAEISYMISDSKQPTAARTIRHDKYIKSSSEWMKLWLLIGRCQLQLYRDWTVTHLKLACHIFSAMSMGVLFGDSGINASKTTSNVSMLVFSVLYVWYTTIMPGVLKFPLEIPVIKKETFNNWYSLRTYYLASQITSIPFHVLLSLVFSAILYAATRQPMELDRYMKFALSLIIITIAADALGILLGTLTDPVNGTFFGATISGICTAFAGCLIFLNHMSPVMQILSYFSLHRYAFQNLILSVYDSGRGTLMCPPDIIYCYFNKPQQILRMLGADDVSYGTNIIVMVSVAVVFKIVGYWTLKRALKLH